MSNILFKNFVKLTFHKSNLQHARKYSNLIKTFVKLNEKDMQDDG